MTRKTTANRGRLPRLDTPSTHAKLRSTSPGDLRGANYSRLGGKTKASTTTTNPSDEKIVLKPALDGGDDHPVPYYDAAEVTLPALAEVPWKDDERRAFRAQVELFERSGRLQVSFLEDFINEAIQDEITAIASVTLEQSKVEEETDRELVGLVEEDFVMPEVQLQVYLTVWSLLYDTGRSLPHDHFLELRKKEDQLVLDAQAKKALMDHVLEGDDWAEDLTEEKLLSGTPWEVLVYHYHKSLQQNALANNVALHMLQERWVLQAAGEEVFTDGVLDTLGDHMGALDELEKLTVPPRQG
ncbi:uncharacterized protein LOC143033237 [Oratosquilla oratoria]|uniref:uncharacterized protein LOC143033237 n=1 Tax=Oratosquilla oratoria TaxID=337810 RepID=UPI003F7688D7